MVTVAVAVFDPIVRAHEVQGIVFSRKISSSGVSVGYGS
jgi:hypothetical protein